MKLPLRADLPTFSISVTSTASSGAALGAAPNAGGPLQIRLVNEGPHRCYFAIGASTVTATVPTGTAVITCTPILAGEDITLTVLAGQTHISAISRSNESATLIVSGADEGM